MKKPARTSSPNKDRTKETPKKESDVSYNRKSTSDPQKVREQNESPSEQKRYKR